MCLAVNNLEAHCHYAAIAVEQFGCLEQELPEKCKLWMVTLVSRRYATSLEEAPNFDVKSLKLWAQRYLRGLNFIATVEAGLYARRKASAQDNHGTVSWHVHTLVWGVSRKRLKARLDKVNAAVEPLIPGAVAAHMSKVVRERFAPRLRYIFKGQLAEYHDWPRAMMIDTETGEVHSKSTQKKRDMRAGNWVRMANALVGRTIPGLTFAAGDGKALLAAINKEALAPLVKFQREEERKRCSRVTRQPRSPRGKSR